VSIPETFLQCALLPTLSLVTVTLASAQPTGIPPPATPAAASVPPTASLAYDVSIRPATLRAEPDPASIALGELPVSAPVALLERRRL
jgi:hypothetical protein